MEQCHSYKIKTCLSKLKTSVNGLSKQEAKKRLERHGYNELPKEKPLTILKIFLSQFNNALVYILLIAGSLSLLLQSFIDAGVIFGAVILNVIIGFFQENKANRAIVKLKQLVEHKAIALRDGREVSLDNRFITVGDVIIIKAGNRVPADARLIEVADLQVSEASLTGESLPSAKKTEEVPRGAALADRENMVYTGTMVVNGLGRAVVTAVGKNTEIGKIAELVSGTKEVKTPLQKRLDKFSRQLGLIFAVVCLVIIAVGLSQGRSLVVMINTGVAVAVASIPEGLTVAVTVILALGMQQILKRKALTRKLIAAETLGTTTVICTDKTGTLTEGRMHVAHIIIGEKEFELASLGHRQEEKEAKAVSLALQTAMMCNDASVENPLDELASWRVIGSPTETALLSAAIQSGLRKEELLKIEPQIDELPFDSERKYMLSLHKKSASGYVLYEKGAPEKILEKSTKFYHHGAETLITASERLKLNSTYENLTSRGLRVIGLAIREIKQSVRLPEFTKGSIDWTFFDKDLIFVGFIAIKDPLRREAEETIKLARQAGIRTVIITGDHKLTARTIGEELGLKVKAENIIVGEELDRIDDESLKKKVKKIDIYARVSPHHKLRIVKALQDKGEVVAMTGDGINDSPALKAADIGISLGTGTDIAKETSDIILLDNNFKTIVAAVHQGRIIFENIRKVIVYLFSDCFSEMMLIIGSLLFKTPLAILPAQILWINIVNDGLPDFSLAFEKSGSDTMNEKPIQKDKPLFNREMKIIIFAVGIIRDLIIFGFFYFLWRESMDLGYLRTLIFVILGVKSLMGIFSLRNLHTPVWRLNPLSNIYLVGAVLVSLIFLILGIYWRPLQIILSTVSLGINAWIIVIIIGLINIILIELVKRHFIIQGKAARSTR